MAEDERGEAGGRGHEDVLYSRPSEGGHPCCVGIRGSGAACAASKFNVVDLVALDQRTISIQCSLVTPVFTTLYSIFDGY